jgi:hypothetical protein
VSMGAEPHSDGKFEKDRDAPDRAIDMTLQHSQMIWPFPQVSYSMRRPLIARAMTSCWICSVPSKMS